MTLRNGKSKIRNITVFKITFEVSIKTFCIKWEGEMIFLIYKQLEKCQNE